ncbi:MAG: helix-turn-helix domain-containing protein [Parasporobacterium sp.]|nr:helix-turn-helix domain-containing protein [Parasporobacterium sp.]MBQ9032059.1 helix-turn-helix domain-containing protein [Parasporobacterium sp.]
MIIKNYISVSGFDYRNVSLNHPDSRIFSIGICPENLEEASPYTLYILDLRERKEDLHLLLKHKFSSISLNVFNLCLICHNTTIIPEQIPGNMNLLVIDSGDPFAELFNRMCFPFFEISSFENSVLSLERESYSPKKTLQILINEAGKRVGNPLWCISYRQQFVAEYHDHNMNYEENVAAVIQEIVETPLQPPHVDFGALFYKAENTNPTLKILNGYPCLIIAIAGNETPLAYLVCPFLQGDPSKYEVFLNYVAFHVRNILLRDSYFRIDMDILDSKYLSSLINGHVQSSKEIEMISEKMELADKSRNFYILTIYPIDKTPVIVHPVVVADFSRMFSKYLFSIENNYLVCLVNMPQDQHMQYTILNEFISKCAKRSRYYCGVSNSFNNLSTCPGAYYQSKKALAIGKKLKNDPFIADHNVFFFRQVMPLALLDEAASVINIRKYVSPTVLQLIEYDKEHNSDYAYSLYCYLESSHNFQTAAKMACVHKNTMVYRIKKIEELTGLSLDDGQECLRLHLSFVILQVLNDMEVKFR